MVLPIVETLAWVCPSSWYCAASECVDECPSGLTACRQSCLNLVSGAAHCGGCERRCADGFACVEAACVTNEGAGLRAPMCASGSLARSSTSAAGPIFMNGANTPWHRWDDLTAATTLLGGAITMLISTRRVSTRPAFGSRVAAR